ncbi:MAG TPA: L-threonylcarbamoyladenylate synthase [Vampirovibrionales bacterium]
MLKVKHNSLFILDTILTDDISKAAELLKQGQIVAFPTETVFGLGALYNNKNAIQNIYKVKGRPSDNPLIVHISNFSQVQLLAKEVPRYAELLMQHFWPGPLTLILNKQSTVPAYTTSGLSTIAIRFPNAKIAQRLIELAGSPLVAPSANLSGKPSSTKHHHVIKDFDTLIPCILKGQSEYGIESTVIDCTQEKPIILRTGSVTKEQINNLGIQLNENMHNPAEKPLSPGMKYKHYAPKAKVVVISAQELNGLSVLGNKVAFIGLVQSSVNFAKKCLCNNLEEYAEQLYDFFRSADEEGVEIIYCQKTSGKGLGSALNNRIEKAAGNI